MSAAGFGLGFGGLARGGCQVVRMGFRSAGSPQVHRDMASASRAEAESGEVTRNFSGTPQGTRAVHSLPFEESIPESGLPQQVAQLNG